MLHFSVSLMNRLFLFHKTKSGIFAPSMIFLHLKDLHFSECIRTPESFGLIV